MNIKHICILLFKALILVMFISGLFHLTLLIIMAIMSLDIRYINPIDFLGISVAFPGLAHNATLAVMGWVALFCLYFILVFLVFRYHKHLGIVNPKGKTNDISKRD